MPFFHMRMRFLIIRGNILFVWGKLSSKSIIYLYTNDKKYEYFCGMSYAVRKKSISVSKNRLPPHSAQVKEEHEDEGSRFPRNVRKFSPNHSTSHYRKRHSWNSVTGTSNLTRNAYCNSKRLFSKRKTKSVKFDNTVNGHSVDGSRMRFEYGALVEWYRQEKTEVLGKKPVSVA